MIWQQQRSDSIAGSRLNEGNRTSRVCVCVHVHACVCVCVCRRGPGEREGDGETKVDLSDGLDYATVGGGQVGLKSDHGQGHQDRKATVRPESNGHVVDRQGSLSPREQHEPSFKVFRLIKSVPLEIIP